jgi:hypothetical protein
MAQRILSATRAFCRLQIAQGTMALYPFPADPSRPVPPDAERWLSRFANHRNRGERRSHLRYWYGFLAGREPSQNLADEFAAELVVTRSVSTAQKVRGTVGSFLRASAAEFGVTPIVAHRRAARRLPDEAEAWVLTAATAQGRNSRRYMLRFWYRFLAGREPTPELGAEFETYIRAAASPSMAPRILTVARVFCRHLISQKVMAVDPFQDDRRRPVPAEAERWLSRFANRDQRRSYLRAWFRFLAGREPSQERADEFAAELVATRSDAMARVVRGTVNSYLRAGAAEVGVAPIVVRLRARIEH